MDAILNLVRKLAPGASAWIAIAVLIIAAAAFLWFKVSKVAAIVLIVGILLIWGGVKLYNFWLARREKKKGKAFGKAIGASREEINQAVGEWDAKWKEAMSTLEDSKKGLYQLPWYMLVGEPQSGKSTTLRFSGLKFPLGDDAIKGGGGTRNCDWWFTNEGVILDTAGRLTMHQSGAADTAEWKHFLGLLGKFRPYCPINGVILVIPADSLLQDPKAERDRKAMVIRDRLAEIQKELSIQFPVYVLITKCDLIYGFTHFFNKVEPGQQREMLGWSAPGQEGLGFEAADFTSSFHRIFNRLTQLRRNFLGDPAVRDNREKIYSFPEEFASLEQPLTDYLTFIFENHIYADVPFFRGYYFTSGQQIGVPILSAGAGLVSGEGRLERLENVFKKQRSFFIRDFYSDKVLPEQGLVSRAGQYQKRDKLKTRIVWGVNLLLILLGLSFCIFAWRGLTARFEKPKNAVIEARSGFKNAGENFFQTDENDRRLIFRTLKDLKEGVGAISEDGFGMYLGSSSNGITENLENTFSYFFMDRIMVGLMDEVNGQLGAFKLSSPPSPRNSHAELNQLLAALTELKTWRLQVAKDEPLGFEPSIEPFLALVVDAEWDNQLADLRGNHSLMQQFQAWFDSSYRASSEEVRRYIITEMVRRTSPLFDNGSLHLRVADFYSNQPELAKYQEKINHTGRIQRQYERVLERSSDSAENRRRMADLNVLFSSPYPELVADKTDRYLSMDEIVSLTAQALGPAFETLVRSGNVDSSNLEGLKKLVFDPRDHDRLPHVVKFVNLLKTLPAKGNLPDPRKVQAPGADGSYVFPDHLVSFHDLILNPYFSEFSGSGDPYAGIPQSGKTFKDNLTKLLTTGSRRCTVLEKVFMENADVLRTSLSDQARVRFSRLMSQFYRDLGDAERSRITQLMERIVAAESFRVSDPPVKWQALVSEFNNLAQAKLNFGVFTQAPDDLVALLDGEFSRQLHGIYGTNHKVVTQIADYRTEVLAGVRGLATQLDRLNQISGTDLARDKTYYRGRFEGINQIERLQALQPPGFLAPHAESLAAWSQAAITAFRAYVNGQDPCPQCRQTLSDFQAAVRRANRGFPMSFSNQLDKSSNPGRLVYTARFTPGDDLDDLLTALEAFRNPSPLLTEYLKRRKLTAFFVKALNWAGSVRDMQTGKAQLSVSVDAPVGTRNGGTTVGGNIAYAKPEGYFKLADPDAIYLSLNPNTPREGLVLNEDRETNNVVFRFLNQENTGNNAGATLVIEEGYMGLMAFLLEGRTGGVSSVYSRTETIPINVGHNGEVTFKFQSSSLIAPPPDWTRVLRK